MKYSALKSILSDSWQIDATTLNQYHPVFKNILAGGSFEVEPEPENTMPFMVTQGGKRVEEKGDIGVLSIRGVMLKHDGVCGEAGMRTQGARLRSMGNNPELSAIVMVIESGGGQSMAVAEVAEVMKEISKPIVVWVDGIMASAAMYVGSYSDYIFASRSTDLIGSIGTMIEYYAPKKQSVDRDGNVYVRIYADGSTEKNLEFEEAVNNANFTPVKEKLLNPINAQFHKDMRANRINITTEQLKGGIFEAGQVVGTLIDEIGTFEQAVEKAYSLAKNNKKVNNQIENKMKIKSLTFPFLANLFAKKEAEIVEQEFEVTNENLIEVENNLKNASETISTLTTEKEAAINLVEAANVANIELQNQLNVANEEIVTLKEKLQAAPTLVEKTEDPSLTDAQNLKSANEKAAEENWNNIKDSE